MYDIFVKLLQNHGITSYKVAKETGISQTTFSNWKSGRSTPKADALQKIADYFGVTVDYLMNGEEKVRGETYYLDDDAREIAQFMFENPEYKVLFDASRRVKKSDIEFVKEMIDRMRGAADDTGC